MANAPDEPTTPPFVVKFGPGVFSKCTKLKRNFIRSGKTITVHFRDFFLSFVQILKTRVAIWTPILIKVLETFQVAGHTFETPVSTLRVRETSEM